MNILRTGIIGTGDYGDQILSELVRNEVFEIKAIADQDRERVRERAGRYEAQAYDDYRSLIVQEALDVLFLALPTYLSGECIQLAAKKGLHLFKQAPLGRTLPEATEWVDLMKKAHVTFHVGSPRRFAPGYLQARRRLQEKQIGAVYLTRAESFVRDPGPLGWRGDPTLAGGGVLLEQAYHLIDELVWNLGPPETVYSVNTDWCSRRALPPYRTEDTCALIMKYSDGAVGNVVAGWMTEPAGERLIFHGTEGSIEAHVNLLRVFNVAGKIVTEEKYEVDASWLIGQQIRHFADSLLDDQIKPVGTAQEHLTNVAVVESAYLSSRTRLPETLKVYGPAIKFSNLPI